MTTRELRRFDRERWRYCADGFEHVLDAADESIEPILQHLRSMRSPYAHNRKTMTSDTAKTKVAA